MPLPFDASMIVEGGRLAAHLMKECQKETPPAASIALAICLVQAAKVAGLRKPRVIELIEILFDQPADGDVRQTAQVALSSLVKVH